MRPQVDLSFMDSQKRLHLVLSLASPSLLLSPGQISDFVRHAPLRYAMPRHETNSPVFFYYYFHLLDFTYNHSTMRRRGVQRFSSALVRHLAFVQNLLTYTSAHVGLSGLGSNTLYLLLFLLLFLDHVRIPTFFC